MSLYKNIIVACALSLACAAPVSAGALTIDDLQSQLKSLVTRVAELTAQMQSMQGEGATSTAVGVSVDLGVSRSQVCTALSRPLSVGVSGNDVKALQEFLRERGFLDSEATGYFGSLTKAAIAKWQENEGISAVGVFGPLSLSRVRAWCGDTSSVTPSVPGCTKEYMPVCGAKPVVCIKAPCNPVPTTYGNRCTMKADGATYLYDGVCKAETADPGADPSCKSWYDGCNSCARSEPGAPAACTLRACVGGTEQKAYCTAYFESGSNKAPVVSSFSGPTTLAADEAGEWHINASDPEGGTLTYSITWGDEVAAAAVMKQSGSEEAFTQESAFTHRYGTAGTYTVHIVVKDQYGAEASASATVRVGGVATACTMEYAPVCGRKPGCANTCAPGMYCTMLCQLHPEETYSNRCMLNAAGAEFIRDGACK